MGKESQVLNQAVEDLTRSFAARTDLIKQQVLLEIIQFTSVCETYEQFRNAMFNLALGYLAELEQQGMVPKGTTEQKRNDLEPLHGTETTN